MIVISALDGFELGEHLFLGVEVVVVDLDAGLFGELGQQLRVDVAFPGEDDQLLVTGAAGRAAEAGQRQRKHQCKAQHAKDGLFHVLCFFLSPMDDFL